jgi:hypothetical protein
MSCMPLPWHAARPHSFSLPLPPSALLPLPHMRRSLNSPSLSPPIWRLRRQHVGRRGRLSSPERDHRRRSRRGAGAAAAARASPAHRHAEAGFPCRRERRPSPASLEPGSPGPGPHHAWESGDVNRRPGVDGDCTGAQERDWRRAPRPEEREVGDEAARARG